MLGDAYLWGERLTQSVFRWLSVNQNTNLTSPKGDQNWELVSEPVFSH